MKGKIAVSLFALPFFGVGVWMLWSIGSTLVDACRMQGWEPVPAVVESGGHTTNSGSDSTTWEAYARYRYVYRGREYRGDRISLAGGGDNVGEYQRELGGKLERAAASGSHITVFVNPGMPVDAIVDRSVRWGLLGFKGIFLLVFGGVGLGLLVFVWRHRKDDDKAEDDPRYAAAPWLLNDDWQTASIRSGSRASMWGAWIFAGIWCLVSSPMPFVAWTEVVEKDNRIALVALLFPLIGVGLLVWAIRRSREWQRFGPAPVTLDPFPGSIGGHVGGSVDLNLPFDPAARFEVTLTALLSYISGSGKNRSRREKADWQDTRLAHAEPGSKGTRLGFRFDVPAGLAPSDADRSDDRYRMWRLNLQAALPGADLDRSYDLPVFATAARSQKIANSSGRIADTQQAEFDQQQLQKRFRFSQSASGARLFFPMGRNLGSGLMGILIGLVFFGAGIFVMIDQGGIIFGSLFAAVGGLIALACFYMTCNSLELLQDGSDLLSVRRLLGMPIKRRRMPRHSVHRLEKSSKMQSQSGGKHTIHYHLTALDRQGQSITLGEGFHGESEARAALHFIARTFNLPEPETVPNADLASVPDNVLASDG